MSNRKSCPITQYSDMTQCEECLLRWDTNDPDEPPCPKVEKWDITDYSIVTPETKRLRDRAIQCVYWLITWAVTIGVVYLVTAPLGRWIAEWLVANS